MLPKPRFGKQIFSHSERSTKLDRPHCKELWTLWTHFGRLTRTHFRVAPVRFGSVAVRLWAVPVFGSFGSSGKGVSCVSAQINREGRFRFLFLKNSSGGSGSDFGSWKLPEAIWPYSRCHSGLLEGSPGFQFRFGSWATLPFTTHLKGGGNRSLKRALRQSGPSIMLKLFLLELLSPALFLSKREEFAEQFRRRLPLFGTVFEAAQTVKCKPWSANREPRVKRGLKKAHKPWTRGNNSAQAVN